MTFDDLFALEPAGTDRWIAPGAPLTDERCVFGGLVIGQAIIAASFQTRRCHALHAFFIGMGAKQVPFEIAIERTRDGGSFSTRGIQIHQGERLLLAGYSSHHDGNDGPEHQAAMPDLPAPEDLENWYVLRAKQAERLGKPMRNYLADRMLDFRPVPRAAMGPGDPGLTQAMWFRSREPYRDVLCFHQAVIGFASDIGPIHVGLQSHATPESAHVQSASLDHSIWFHSEAPADDWLLHVLHSPVAGNGRGLSHGTIFTRDGRLVASVAQEFLARKKQG